MRSCYPEFIVPKRKSFGINLVENSSEVVPEDDEADSVIQEVETFLADHALNEPDDDPQEVYEESEIAEALAVSWKDKRRELGRLQRSRRFGAASELKKSLQGGD